jgi:integrase
MPRLHDELLFVTKRGRVLWAPNRNTIWNPVRAYAQRPTMVMHELRHYAVTWLLEQGVSDSDVATQVGHLDGGKLVRSTYGHPRRNPALQRVRQAFLAADETHQAEEAAS